MAMDNKEALTNFSKKIENHEVDPKSTDDVVVDGKVNAWVDSARIKRHYKELLKQDCKKSTRRRLWSIVGLLAIIFVVGSYYGLFDLFNDLLTILALAVSISSSWIVQTWACHIETLAQNNRPIK